MSDISGPMAIDPHEQKIKYKKNGPVISKGSLNIITFHMCSSLVNAHLSYLLPKILENTM